MPKVVAKLNNLQVRALKADGLHACGDGLYIQIRGSSRGWIFRYQVAGQRHDMGLGSTAEVTLKSAREVVDDARRMIRAGVDPINARRADERPKVPTFGEFADEFIESRRVSYRSAKHFAQWETTLGKVPYVKSKIRIDRSSHDAHITALTSLRSLRVDEVTTADVIAVITPIWSVSNETASRLRGRIESILDAAKVKGLRSGENPALWKGHLSAILPPRQKLQRGHHRAMPWPDVPAFVADLRTRDATSARALEFTVLTAVRTSETLGATWGEIDTTDHTWTIPANRTKAGRVHQVPLSSRAIKIIDEMRVLAGANAKAANSTKNYIFPGQKQGRPLSSMAMLMLLRRMGVNYIATTHGFRSTLRDWAGDETEYARETAEAALSHAVGGATERAYRRGNALEKRRKLMDDWAEYVGTPVKPEGEK